MLSFRGFQHIAKFYNSNGLGLELRPPFTGLSVRSANNHYLHSGCLDLLLSSSSTGQVSDPIRHAYILQSPVFLINSRHPQYCVAF